MDVIYALGEATAAEVRETMADAPSYSTVRTLLRVLTEKGLLEHAYRGPRYVYSPVVPLHKARRSAVRRLLQTFFSGAPDQAVATLLDLSRERLDDETLDRLEGLIEAARSERRGKPAKGGKGGRR